MNIAPTHRIVLPADRREALLEIQKHLGLAKESDDRLFRFEKATFVLGQVVVSDDRLEVAHFANGICPVGFVRLENVLTNLRNRVAQDQVWEARNSIQGARRLAAEKRRNVDVQTDDREISIAFRQEAKIVADRYALTWEEKVVVVKAYMAEHPIVPTPVGLDFMMHVSNLVSRPDEELTKLLRQARNAKQQKIEAENHAKKLALKAELKAKKEKRAEPAKVDKKAKKQKHKKAA